MRAIVVGLVLSILGACTLPTGPKAPEVPKGPRLSTYAVAH
jgi:hypothetical protein